MLHVHFLTINDNSNKKQYITLIAIQIRSECAESSEMHQEARVCVIMDCYPPWTRSIHCNAVFRWLKKMLPDSDSFWNRSKFCPLRINYNTIYLHSNNASVATFSLCLLDKFVCFVIKMQKKFVLVFACSPKKQWLLWVFIKRAHCHKRSNTKHDVRFSTTENSE